MSEIEKMYENAGIEKCNRFLKPCPFGNECDGCEHYWYPEFTAKKQIELIKWLAKNKSDYGLQYQGSAWCNCCDFCWEYFDKASEDKNFEESLAGLINILWQDLTEEEKQQVKGILE